MAESKLNLQVTDLRSEVGRFLGWGRDPARWSASKLEEIDTLVSSCLRKFYFQAQLNPQDGAHQWTFLKRGNDVWKVRIENLSTQGYGQPAVRADTPLLWTPKATITK